MNSPVEAIAVSEEPEGIVWVKDGCPRCAAVKEHLSGRRVDCRPIEMVLTGQDPHCVDAMAQLAWQDWELPVILLDDVFVQPEKLLPKVCSPGASVCTLTPKGGATCTVGSPAREETTT